MHIFKLVSADGQSCALTSVSVNMMNLSSQEGNIWEKCKILELWILCIFFYFFLSLYLLMYIFHFSIICFWIFVILVSLKVDNCCALKLRFLIEFVHCDGGVLICCVIFQWMCGFYCTLLNKTRYLAKGLLRPSYHHLKTINIRANVFWYVHR